MNLSPEINIIAISTRKGQDEISLKEIAKRFGKEQDAKTLARCGTTNLYKFAEGESLEFRATDAALDTLIDSNLLRHGEPSKIDGIYSSVATSSTNFRIPGLARIVGKNLHLQGPMINLSMGCAGGIHALQAAYNQSLIDSIQGKNTNYLVISGDHTEKVLDQTTWGTSGLFSDGVAAMIISNHMAGNYSIKKIESTTLDGNIDSMTIKNSDPYFRMEGPDVMEFGSKKVFPAVLKLLDLDNLPDNCYFIPHQASGAVLGAMQRRYKLPDCQFYSDGIKTIGNMPGSSVFFGLEDTLKRDLAGNKDLILAGFGAELSVGAAYLKKNNNFVSEDKK